MRSGRSRHSSGYYLPNKGYELRLIQDFLGHRDPKHTVDHIIGPLARRLPAASAVSFLQLASGQKSPGGERG